MARKPLCFSNGRGARGAVRQKGTALSQNRRRRQKWGTTPQRDPGLKDMQDCFVHFGAMRNRATDHDRLGWEPPRTDVYKRPAELPSPGLGLVASTKLVLSSPPHPIFPEGTSGTHHPGTESAVGCSNAGAAGGSCLSGGLRANSVAHRDTHVRTDRSCEPAHVGLLPSSPWPGGSTFSLQFSSRHGPWASRINPASPWLVPVSPSSGVPNPAWAKGHRSGVWGSCRARSCSAPRPAGFGTL